MWRVFLLRNIKWVPRPASAAEKTQVLEAGTAKTPLVHPACDSFGGFLLSGILKSAGFSGIGRFGFG